MIELENKIISNLISNDVYARQVTPHIKPEYFHHKPHSQIVKLFLEYFNKYSKRLTKQILSIEASNLKINDKDFENLMGAINSLDDTEEKENIDWLLENTEKFCKEKSVHNAILDSVSILQESPNDLGKILDLMNKALAVSFDTNIGHDYFSDADARFDFYHNVEDKIPFDIDKLNEMTNGGIHKKTLNVILATTNTGKTMKMCHHATSYIKSGWNVLYVTLEMSQEKISERIDFNLLDITENDLKKLTKEEFLKKVKRAKDKVTGKLIVKNYPTSTIHAGHIRALLTELKNKQKFKPDVIMIDYINLMNSQRFKPSSGTNSYNIVKAIAEEIRGIAVEFDAAMWTATQTTRGGFNNEDVSLTDTSESIALPATADFMIALVSNEEFGNDKQLIKQLKNRYRDIGLTKSFLVGVDKSKQRYYNLENSSRNDEFETKLVSQPRNKFNNFR